MYEEIVLGAESARMIRTLYAYLAYCGSGAVVGVLTLLPPASFMAET